MTSTPTIRNRLLKMGTGDAVNTWGDQQSSGDFDMIDIALDGMLSLSISGSVVLSTANYVADQARNRLIKILSSSTVGATITLPGVEKWVLVWNASTFDQIFASQGGGSSVTVKSGELVPIMTDASNVARLTLLTMNGAQLRNVADPSSPQDACTKAYADALSFAAFSGSLPGQVGNAGKFLTTNGSTPSWGYAVTIGAGLATVSNATVTVTPAAAAEVRGGTDTSKAVVAAGLMGSAARQTLTDATTIAFNTALGYNATVSPTVTGRTIAAPSGAIFDGLPISLEIVNVAGGTLAVTWTSGTGGWDFGTYTLPSVPTTAGGALLVSAAYNARTSKWDVLGYRKSAL